MNESKGEPQQSPAELAVYAQPAEEKANDTRFFFISATQSWQSTNMEFQVGDLLNVEYVSGEWTGDRKHDKKHGPEGPPADAYPGGPTYPLPGTIENSLIGKIGNGPAFYVGRGITKRVTEIGVLSFTINDEPKGYWDNEGSINVGVRLPI